MADYKHIEKIIPQDDGTMSVLLRGNRQAIIEIISAENNFKAAVYYLKTGYPPAIGRKKRKNLLAQFYGEGAREAMLEAVGWVDEHPGEFVDAQEINLDTSGGQVKKTAHVKRMRPHKDRRVER